MPDENFSTYISRPERMDEFFRELRTFHDQTQASEVIKVFHNAEYRIDYAVDYQQIEAIINQTRQALNLIAKKCNLHDASRVDYLMATFAGNARAWFSKNRRQH